MPIMYQEVKNGRVCPRIFCDECGERILKGQDANVCWVRKGEEDKRYLDPKIGDRYDTSIACKKCFPASNRKYVCMAELHHFFFYLSNNIDMQQKEAEATCKFMARIGM